MAISSPLIDFLNESSYVLLAAMVSTREQERSRSIDSEYYAPIIGVPLSPIESQTKILEGETKDEVPFFSMDVSMALGPKLSTHDLEACGENPHFPFGLPKSSFGGDAFVPPSKIFVWEGEQTCDVFSRHDGNERTDRRPLTETALRRSTACIAHPEWTTRPHCSDTTRARE